MTATIQPRRVAAIANQLIADVEGVDDQTALRSSIMRARDRLWQHKFGRVPEYDRLRARSDHARLVEVAAILHTIKTPAVKELSRNLDRYLSACNSSGEDGDGGCTSVHCT